MSVKAEVAHVAPARLRRIAEEAGVITRLGRNATEPETSPAVDRGRLYRVPVVAAMLDVSRSTVYRAIAAGAVPAVRIGSSVRIHGATLASLLEAGLPESPTPVETALVAAS